MSPLSPRKRPFGNSSASRQFPLKFSKDVEQGFSDRWTSPQEWALSSVISFTSPALHPMRPEVFPYLCGSLGEKNLPKVSLMGYLTECVKQASLASTSYPSSANLGAVVDAALGLTVRLDCDIVTCGCKILTGTVMVVSGMLLSGSPSMCSQSSMKSALNAAALYAVAITPVGEATHLGGADSLEFREVTVDLRAIGPIATVCTFPESRAVPFPNTTCSSFSEHAWLASGLFSSGSAHKQGYLRLGQPFSSFTRLRPSGSVIDTCSSTLKRDWRKDFGELSPNAIPAVLVRSVPIPPGAKLLGAGVYLSAPQ